MDEARTPRGGTILWLRRDLRLTDQPAWHLALENDGPVWPVFILDSLIEKTYGAAPKWRLAESLRSLADRLEKRGSRLVLRRGDPLKVLRSLITETGAQRVIWSRLYDRESNDRDSKIRSALNTQGIRVHDVNSSLIFEPWTVANQNGTFYQVFTPFWRVLRNREVEPPLKLPFDLAAPLHWPATDSLCDWKLDAAMDRGAVIVARHARVGEAAAQERLQWFIGNACDRYGSERNYPSLESTSGLSENLTYGEISPRTIWHSVVSHAEVGGDKKKAEPFLRQLAWREFAYHLLHHTPHIISDNWRPEWKKFPWRDDNEDAEAWRRGMTGIEIVDAAMREMFVTGTMHNRCRMLVASFLTKHLLTDWRVGEAWFRECLIDWDIASNAMGWQWTAGSGPDAAPYFRVFNPETQAERYDPNRIYRDRFLTEGRSSPHEDGLSFFEAAPRTWGLSAVQAYPRPIIDLEEGRNRAMEAYRSFRDR